MARKNRNAAAAGLALALSLLVAPAALAEPVEGDLLGSSTATVEPAPGWEHNKNYIEYLEQQQLAAQSSTTGSSEPQMPKAQIEYLEQQQLAAQSSTTGSSEPQMPKAQIEYLERLAAGEEPATEAADDSGPGWLLGAGVVTAVAIGSVVVAAIRSRRPETAEPAEHEREKLTV